MKNGIMVTLAGFLLIASCSKSGSGDGGGAGTGGGGGGTTINCTGVPISFAGNVHQIIQSNCATDATCHGAGSSNGPGPLLTYLQISNASALIKIAVSNGTMPKTGTLTTTQKNSIICWINAGAPDN